MADLILGQPTNLTTITNNGAGWTRVLFAPWELDWEFFDAINVGHWMANTTLPDLDQIDAKGGSEHLGYWFDVHVAFPAGGWLSGHRCTPTRSATWPLPQYPTFLAATIAMANDDYFLVWYSDAANRRQWNEICSFIDEGGSVWGMLSRQQIEIGPSADDTGCVFWGGNLAGPAQQMELINLTMTSVGDHAVRYSPVAQQEGTGVYMRRFKIRGGTTGIWVERSGFKSWIIDSGQITGCLTGVLLGANADSVNILHVVAANCNAGFNFANAGTVARNLVGSECVTCFQGVGIANAINCADTDGTLPVDPTNLRNQDARANFQFFHDLARPGDKAFDYDFRIHEDSNLNGAGVWVPGMSRDPDGIARVDPPAIGAWEPRSTCYAPGAEIVRGVGKRGTGT